MATSTIIDSERGLTLMQSRSLTRDFIHLGSIQLECQWLDAQGNRQASQTERPASSTSAPPTSDPPTSGPPTSDPSIPVPSTAGPSTPSPALATLVFLHEGLGSITMWRDFPAQLCRATGLPGFVYAREGYGASTPLASPRAVDYLHREAGRVLPQVLAAAGIVNPILVGHSDGASIALLHAGLFPGVAKALLVLAPHLFVETITVQAIAEVNRRFHDRGDNRLRAALSRHHQSLDSAFGGWAGIWLNPDFLAFNIEAEVAQIRCPVLAIQGADDPYGSARQVERIAELCPGTSVHLLPDCRHNPHLEQDAQTLGLCKAFIGELSR